MRPLFGLILFGLLGGVCCGAADPGPEIRKEPERMPRWDEGVPLYQWRPDLLDGGYNLYRNSDGCEWVVGYIVPAWNGAMVWHSYCTPGSLDDCPVPPPPVWTCWKNLRKAKAQ